MFRNLVDVKSMLQMSSLALRKQKPSKWWCCVGKKSPSHWFWLQKKYRDKHSVAYLALIWQVVGFFFILRSCLVLFFIIYSTLKNSTIFFSCFFFKKRRWIWMTKKFFHHWEDLLLVRMIQKKKQWDCMHYSNARRHKS